MPFVNVITSWRFKHQSSPNSKFHVNKLYKWMNNPKPLNIKRGRTKHIVKCLNSMNYTGQNKLLLSGRNEGKIKSYESCADVRAWSHVCGARASYLREWIKCDMPICVIPFGTLAGFLRMMTCRRRGKVTPHCHPDCKSRLLLESICTSCDAMKECLKNNEHFEKYFDEEEFETSHWPCERCLDALKSIKMLWKIIIEKFFKLNIPKGELDKSHSCNHCVRSVARFWQNEMLQIARCVKNAPCENLDNNINTCNIPKTLSSFELGEKSSQIKINKVETKSIIDSDFDIKSYYSGSKLKKIRKCRSTSTRVKRVDVGCDSCQTVQENEEIAAFKNNINYLQKQYYEQLEELERLKKENNSLKIELQNVYNKSRTFFYPTDLKDDAIELVPKPFESCLEGNTNDDINNAKNIDSEMIITMKDCKAEQSFKHVSLLQVLHKTNGPMLNDHPSNEACFKKEDPLDLLTKVQNTFGAIVKREMSIAIERGNLIKRSDIDACFQKVISSKSAPSCSTISFAPSTVSAFMSTQEAE